MRSVLRGLDSRNAEQVAKHLVAAGVVVDDDPELALAHARAARDRASRLAVVREAVGVAAYHAGDYAEAARELRAYRRMTGDEGYRAVLADCERALGRSDVALRLVAEALAAGPDAAEEAELRLVEAGARRDLGETAAARLVLETALGGRPRPELVRNADAETLRLAAGYADLLRETGAEQEAERWLAALAEADPENLLGVAESAEIEFSDEDDEDAAADDVPPAALPDGTDLQADIEAEVAELLGETGPESGPGGPEEG